MTTDQIYSSAMALPETNRAELAYQLLKSLRPASVLSEDDPGFANELERRVAAYEAGETSASDWDDVSARLHQRLNGGSTK